MKLLSINLIAVFAVVSFSLFANKGVGAATSACEGMINIFKSGEYNLSFIGKKGKSSTFAAYPALREITSANQIWFSFIAPADGQIKMDVKSDSVTLKMIIFNAADQNPCSEISHGNAEIIRMLTAANSKQIGLREDVQYNYLYNAPITEGNVYYFVVVGDQDIADRVKVDFKFVPKHPEFTEFKAKEVNLKEDDFAPTLNIRVRDRQTNQPLIADISLKGDKGRQGLYEGSDITLDITRSGKISLRIETPNYFYLDTANIPCLFNEDKEIVIYLDRVQSGRSVQIEDIEFIPGTSQIVEKSIPRLNRLRDFLAMNSEMNIEIRGHVFEPGGENSFSGQKMSEARAKRVMKYLIDNGIAKERLSAVGMGATVPLFPFPKTYAEEQANRRVEIYIK